MGAMRAGGLLLGLGLLAFEPAARATADEAAIDLPLPDLPVGPELSDPQATAERESADAASAITSASAEEAGDPVVLPEPPPVLVDVPATLAAEAPGSPADVAVSSDPPVADPVRTGSTPDAPLAAPASSEAVSADTPLDLPAAPEPVVLSPDDVLPAAIELRLADPKLALPAKLARKDRDAIAAFYKGAGHRSLWLRDGAWTSRAKALAETLADARADGLDPVDYPVPRLEPGASAQGAGDLAEAELKLSAAAYLYARDARGGRVDPSRLGGLVTPKLEVPSAEVVLAALAASDAPGRALAAYNPAYPGYLALRAKLAELRANRPAGALDRPPAGGGLVRQAGRGVADTATLPKVAPARLEGDIVANMERWRWLPAEIGERNLIVNIPEFRLRLYEGGKVTYETRVATGTPRTPTPIFSDTMQYAVVNPSWYVPPSIVRQHAANFAADPTYAGRAGLNVIRSGRAVTYRMPPGPNNPLGHIKFMFPNGHAVYLHDTNGRNVFGSPQRAISHGCVRVENPFALGGRIMGDGWSEARLKSLIGHGERAINLEHKLPISLAYFTVWVDETGEVHQFGDIYGHHARLRQALGLGL